MKVNKKLVDEIENSKSRNGNQIRTQVGFSNVEMYNLRLVAKRLTAGNVGQLIRQIVFAEISKYPDVIDISTAWEEVKNAAQEQE